MYCFLFSAAGCQSYVVDFHRVQFDDAVRESGYDPILERGQLSALPGSVLTSGGPKREGGYLVCKWSDVLRSPPSSQPYMSASPDLRAGILNREKVASFLPGSISDTYMRQLNVGVGDISEVTTSLSSLAGGIVNPDPECSGAVKQLSASGQKLEVVISVLNAELIYTFGSADKTKADAQQQIAAFKSRLPYDVIASLTADGNIEIRRNVTIGVRTIPISKLGWVPQVTTQ